MHRLHIGALALWSSCACKALCFQFCHDFLFYSTSLQHHGWVSFALVLAVLPTTRIPHLSAGITSCPVVAERVETWLNVMLRKERLSLRGTGQPIDRDHPPNLPQIWSRRHNDVPALLQSNVDAVIAQVSSVTNVYFGPQCQHHCFLLCCKQPLEVLHV